MGPGLGAGSGDDDGRLSPQLDALLTLRRLCKEYHALPSQVMAEDGGLLLQLLEVDGIMRTAADEAARSGDHIEVPEGVLGDGSW